MAGEEKDFQKEKTEEVSEEENGTIRKNWQKMMQVKICA